MVDIKLAALEQEAEEKKLIRGCRKGRRHSQELLYRHFYGFGMSICLRYTSSEDEAKEVLNDGFMKVFQHIKQYDDSRPFKSWFRKILVNTALDHYRANKKYRLQVDLNPDMFDSTEEPTMYQQLAVAEILVLFRRLPEIYRITFNLFEVEGYSHQEIGGMLDISPGTSRSNLSRAKNLLRKMYMEMKKKQCHEAI